MVTLKASLLTLAESLLTKRKRAIVDPLNGYTARALRRRFRLQAAAVEAAFRDRTPVLVDLERALQVTDAAEVRRLNLQLTKAYAAGAAIVTAAGAAGVMGPVDRARRLFAEMDRTSAKWLNEAIQAGIAARLGKRALKQTARDLFTDWVKRGPKSRANVAAVNEVSKAFHAGMVDMGTAAGGKLKVWAAQARACPVCRMNAGDAIPVDWPFPSGDYYPPQHPSCRCSIRIVNAA